MGRGGGRRIVVGTGLAVGAPFALAPAGAQAIEVSNTNTSGAGSLAQAVFSVNSSPTEDTITFASSLSGQTISPSAELIFDADEIYIVGPGADKLTISGSGAHRIFSFDPDNPGDVAQLRGLTLTQGNAGGSTGGEVRNVDANLLIADSVLSGGQAFQGGGLWSDFPGRVERSTISGNTASSGGGGIYADAALGVVAGSTITGNTAAFGGGISSNGATSVYDSTIASNAATSSGGGIYNESGATQFLFSTIVADNTVPGGANGDLKNGFQASSSLIEGAPGAAIAQGPGGPNLIGVDPQLTGLAANGGPTQTMRPAATSPALDKGRASGPATDQRGLPRPFDIPTVSNATGGAGADIGAVELQAGEFPKPKCKQAKKKKKGKAAVAQPSAKKNKKKKRCKKKRKKGKKQRKKGKK